MATVGSSWPVSAPVFSYFADRARQSTPPARGCCTRGLVLTGEPISSSVLTVEAGEGTRGWPGCGTEGFLAPGEERGKAGASPGIRTFGPLSGTGESDGDSTSAMVSSTPHWFSPPVRDLCLERSEHSFRLGGLRGIIGVSFGLGLTLSTSFVSFPVKIVARFRRDFPSFERHHYNLHNNFINIFLTFDPISLMLVLGKIEVLEPIELIDPLLVLQN